MRSWTTFLVFGVIIVAFVLFWSITRSSTEKIPAVGTAKLFLDAVKRNDATAAKQYLDSSQAALATAGNTIINVNFRGTGSVITVVYAKQDPITWDYKGLSGLDLELEAKPTILEKGIARVPLTFGRSIYLRTIDNQWKIFYITKGDAQ